MTNGANAGNESGEMDTPEFASATSATSLFHWCILHARFNISEVWLGQRLSSLGYLHVPPLLLVLHICDGVFIDVRLAKMVDDYTLSFIDLPIFSNLRIYENVGHCSLIYVKCRRLFCFWNNQFIITWKLTFPPLCFCNLHL